MSDGPDDNRNWGVRIGCTGNANNKLKDHHWHGNMKISHRDDGSPYRYRNRNSKNERQADEPTSSYYKTDYGQSQTGQRGDQPRMQSRPTQNGRYHGVPSQQHYRDCHTIDDNVRSSYNQNKVHGQYPTRTHTSASEFGCDDIYYSHRKRDDGSSNSRLYMEAQGRLGVASYSEDTPSLTGSDTSLDNSNRNNNGISGKKTETFIQEKEVNNQAKDEDCDRKLPPRTRSNESFYRKWKNSHDGDYNTDDYDRILSSSHTVGNRIEQDLTTRTTTITFETTLLIEVFPGIHLPVRGADETWNAMMNDFYIPNQCMGCDRTVFCIQDSNYLLCPVCRVISPISYQLEEHDAESRNNTGGVGLGFTVETFAEWQKEVSSYDCKNNKLIMAKSNIEYSYSY